MRNPPFCGAPIRMPPYISRGCAKAAYWLAMKIIAPCVWYPPTDARIGTKPVGVFILTL
jgi:hypothetical protein